MNFKLFAASAFALCLSACGGEDTPRPIVQAPAPAPSPTPVPTPTPTPPPTGTAFPLELTAATSPVALSNANFAFYQDVKYGDGGRQQLDLFLPHGVGNAGLVVFFHGGGLAAGDKDQVYSIKRYRETIDAYLSQNIAFATVRYSLVGLEKNALDSFADGARALQFLRHYAPELGLNRDKVVLIGASAGGTMALDIAMSDDIAQSDSEDLLQRQSSRVAGVHADTPQAHYDFSTWIDDIFSSFVADGLSTEGIFAIVGEANIRNLLGLAMIEEIETATETRAALDLLEKLTPDDPPLYLSSNRTAALPSNYSEAMHHPLHVKALAERAVSQGIPVSARAEQLGIDTTQGITFYDWSLQRLR